MNIHFTILKILNKKWINIFFFSSDPFKLFKTKNNELPALIVRKDYQTPSQNFLLSELQRYL